MLAFGAQIAGIYTHDAAVIALAANLLLFSAAFQLSDGVQVVSGAALRGMKDARVPMLLTALSYWGVGMTLGATLGFGLGWGPQGMWCGLGRASRSQRSPDAPILRLARTPLAVVPDLDESSRTPG